MTDNGTKTARPKLSFRRTLREAFYQVFGRFKHLAKLAFLPMVLSLAISTVVFILTAVDTKSTKQLLYTTPLHLLGLLPFAVFGVASCRLMLLGEESRLMQGSFFGRRQRTWLAYSILTVLLLALPIPALLIPAIVFFFVANPVLAVLTLVAIPVRLIMPWELFMKTFLKSDLLFALKFAPQAGRFGIFFPHAGEISLIANIQYLWFWPGFLLLLLLAMRFSLVLPGLAVDDRKGEVEDYRLGLLGAWRLASGSGLKLITILFALTAIAFAGRAFFLFILRRIYSFLYNQSGFLPGFGDSLYTLT